VPLCKMTKAVFYLLDIESIYLNDVFLISVLWTKDWTGLVHKPENIVCWTTSNS